MAPITIKLTVDEEMAHFFLKYMYMHMKAYIYKWLLVKGVPERTTFVPQRAPGLLHVFGYVEHHVGTIR